jgi:hypothetical protein
MVLGGRIATAKRVGTEGVADRQKVRADRAQGSWLSARARDWDSR